MLKPITLTARTLRDHPTQAHLTLWQELRARRLKGLKFRRQHVIAPYIVDFYCPAKRLIIEVLELERDFTLDKHWQAQLQREAWLESQHYRVLRFMNTDVLFSLPDVMILIAAEVDKAS